MESDSQLVEECNKRVELGKSLLDTINSLNHDEIEGLDKLANNINKDINFLTVTLKKGLLKKDHVAGSIINQYDYLLSYLLNSKNCTAVLKAFRFKPESSGQKEMKIYVDIVSEGKKKWTKVIRKNPKALSLISLGEGDFGRKSIIDQAKEYLECAEQNLHFFKSPLVEFYFACGIESALAQCLTEVGIHVIGNICSNDDVENEALNQEVYSCNKPFQRHEFCTVNREAVTKLNLDVNTMISYVSGLTNGQTNEEFQGRIMMEQAKEEKDCPLKPTLERIFHGKDLYACESAVKSFRAILEVQGGEGEKSRAEELLRRVSVVPDCDDYQWSLEGKGIKKRAAAVFATGAALGAVTVTASMGFVNAIKQQGYNVNVIIHEPRSLSEVKGRRVL